MTLKDMQYISLIASEKSITKAAARLFVAQPALSQCVQKVERELGFLLFVRSASGVTMTAEGQRFLEFVNKTLYEEKKMRKEIRDISRGDRGEVRLGFTGSQAACVLPHFLSHFKEEWPHINIILEEADSERIEEMLVSGLLDVAILHPPILQQELTSFELLSDRMVIIPRSNSKYKDFIYKKQGEMLSYLKMDFFKTESVALTQERQRSRMITDQIFAKAGVIPQIKQISRNLSTLDALATVDYATVILPEKQLSVSLRQKEYFLIDEKYSVPFGFFAAYVNSGYISQAAKRMLEFLKREFDLTET